MAIFQLSAPNQPRFGQGIREGLHPWFADAGFVRGLVWWRLYLSIAVTAFAFTAILGLMATGLGVFSQSRNIGVTSLIEQQILSQLNTMSFNTLTGSTYYSAPSTTAYRLPITSGGTTTYTRFLTIKASKLRRVMPREFIQS